MKLLDKDGFSTHRFESNPLEKKYAEEWVKYSSTGNMLKYLLSPDNDISNTTATDRDRYVANKLIQWLGSPCGQYFISLVKND